MLLKMFRFCLDAKQKFNEEVQEFDLTFSQWQVLKIINLSETKELTINEIVISLNSDKATVSLIVKKLKEKNMLTTSTKSSDKRKVYLSLTEEMKNKCTDLRKVESNFMNNFLSNLTEEEQKTLNNLINKI